MWIEEEKIFALKEVNEGFIKFTGTKSSMKGKGGKMLRNVAVTFKVNRLTGRFDAEPFLQRTAVGNCDFDVKQL